MTGPERPGRGPRGPVRAGNRGPSGPVRPGNPGPSGPVRAGNTGPQPLGPSLDRLTRGLGAPDTRVLTTLFGQWNDLVGPEVAAHAEPLSLLRGTLVVGVDAPAWASHLRFLESDLLGRLEGALGPGQVTRVELRVHPR